MIRPTHGLVTRAPTQGKGGCIDIGRLRANVNRLPPCGTGISSSCAIGDVEISRFANTVTRFPGHVHPPYAHLVSFQVLERNRGPPLPHETGWKDTIRLAEGDAVRVIMLASLPAAVGLWRAHDLNGILDARRFCGERGRDEGHPAKVSTDCGTRRTKGLTARRYDSRSAKGV
jgi:hypothetical protein